MIRFDDTDSLALLYHINSEPWLNEDAYRDAAYDAEYKRIGPRTAEVSLPVSPKGELETLLRTRRSCRRFAQRDLPIATLGRLLAAAYGVTEVVELPEGFSMERRSVPSAGALFPLEIYVLAQRVDNLTDGLYHYDVREHALEPMGRATVMAGLEGALLAYPFIEHANIVVCLAAVFRRTLKKYGPRGYRYILLEAGHVAQNVCLSAADQGLGSLCMGGFFDTRLNRILGLPTGREGVVYALAAGYASSGNDGV